MRWREWILVPLVTALSAGCMTTEEKAGGEGLVQSQSQDLLPGLPLLSCMDDNACSSGLVCKVGGCLFGQCIFQNLLGCDPSDPDPGNSGSGGSSSGSGGASSGTGGASSGSGGSTSNPGLLGCEVPDDCDNGLLCSLPQCLLGTCLLNPILECDDSTPGGGVIPPINLGCNANNDCKDDNACTLDVCVSVLGMCVNTGILGCEETNTPCSQDSECGDGDVGVGLCIAGRCVISVGVDLPGGGSGGSSGGGTGGNNNGSGGASTGGGTGGNNNGSGGSDNPDPVGVSCDSALDCEDNDPCTLDVCVEPLKLCAHVELPGCGDDGGVTTNPNDDDGKGKKPGSGASGEPPGSNGLDSDGDDDKDGNKGDKDGKDADDDLEYRGGACSFSTPGGPGGPFGWFAGIFLAGLLFRRFRSSGNASSRSARASAWLAGGLSVFALTGLPQTASAQGFSVDGNHAPVAPEDLLWTERPALPMDNLSFFARAMVGYAHNPLVLRNNTTGEDSPVIEDQYALYLSAGIAFVERFHIAALVPLYLQTGASAPVPVLDPEGFAVGNPAADVRITILDRNAPFELGLAGRVTIPVGESGRMVADEAATGGPRLLIGKSFGEKKRSFIAINTGAVFREERVLGNVVANHRWTFGAGMNIAFWGPLAFLAEVSGSTSFDDAFREDVTPLGALFGLRYAPEGWSIAGGAGPGLSGGYGTPDVRALATGGVRFNRKKEPEPVELEPVVVQERTKMVEVDPCLSENPPADPALCPELDADQDGIINRLDQCPLEPEDFDGFEDEDGCPDLDNDGDGIPDTEDQCPLDAETFNGIDDEDGCPDKIRVLDGQIATLEPIFFEYNSDKIQSRSEPLLIEMARVIQQRENLGMISIEGHTDERGPEEYNMALSQKRAESVRAFLIGAGVDPNRLRAIGYGETRLLNTDGTDAAHAMNRRVEFRFGQ